MWSWSRDGVPALAAVRVAGDVLGRDAGLGTVTHLTAHQGMAAESLRLTLHALRAQCSWRTDTLSCHWLTQACATITRYRHEGRDAGQTNMMHWVYKAIQVS